METKTQDLPHVRSRSSSHDATILRSLAYTSKNRIHEMDAASKRSDVARPIADLFPHCTGELPQDLSKV